MDINDVNATVDEVRDRIKRSDLMVEKSLVKGDLPMDINDVNAVARVWTVDEVRDRIKRSDLMVEKSLVKLLEKQTEDEQTAEATRHLNGKGFNAKDARFGTALAKVVVGKKRLSPKQIECARRMLVKYSAQLTRIANGDMK